MSFNKHGQSVPFWMKSVVPYTDLPWKAVPVETKQNIINFLGQAAKGDYTYNLPGSQGGGQVDLVERAKQYLQGQDSNNFLDTAREIFGRNVRHKMLGYMPYAGSDVLAQLLIDNDIYKGIEPVMAYGMLKGLTAKPDLVSNSVKKPVLSGLKKLITNPRATASAIREATKLPSAGKLLVGAGKQGFNALKLGQLLVLGSLVNEVGPRYLANVLYGSYPQEAFSNYMNSMYGKWLRGLRLLAQGDTERFKDLSNTGLARYLSDIKTYLPTYE